jgi:plastocyanin
MPNLARRLSVTGIAMSAFAAVLAASPAAAADYTVTMSNMNYGAVPSGLKVGDTITWTNHDSVPHTVTARDHSFDLRIQPGQSMKQSLAKAGAFPFYCIYHAQMRGTLKVADK